MTYLVSWTTCALAIPHVLILNPSLCLDIRRAYTSDFLRDAPDRAKSLARLELESLLRKDRTHHSHYFVAAGERSGSEDELDGALSLICHVR